MSEELCLYERRGRVAVLTFNRPDRMNAFTNALGAAFFDALDRAEADPEVNVIVVTGAGRGFCVGADMDVLQGSDADRPDPRGTLHPMRITKMIVAAINGPCAGLGFALALTADIRIAAAGVKFTAAFSRRGLIAEHGTSWTLPRIVGYSRAIDILASGRVFLSEEALELGVVNRVVPGEELVDAALAYADDVAANVSPRAIAVTKQQLMTHPGMEYADAWQASNGLMAASLRRPDFKEGVDSFVEKRPPSFAPWTGGDPLVDD